MKVRFLVLSAYKQPLTYKLNQWTA